MTAHISVAGFGEDDLGFVVVGCGCGATIGPAPDEETALDMAMEHAYNAGLTERSDVAKDSRGETKGESSGD